MACPTSPSVSVSRRGSADGDPERTVLWVGGDQDIATKVSLVATIARAAQLDDVPLLIDLSAVTFMDASIVGAIIGSRNQLRSRARSLELRAPSPAALRVLELCGLANLVHRDPIHSTAVGAALATWVDVPSTAPAGRIDHADGRITARATTRQPARVPAAEVERGGP